MGSSTLSFVLQDLLKMFFSVLADYLSMHYENISGNADWTSLTVISLNWFSFLEGLLKIWLDDFITSGLKSL